MLRPITRTSAVLVALALTFPAAGMAQGAGDQQYADPFTESQGGGNSGSGGGNQGGSGSGSSTPSQPQGNSGTTAQAPQSTAAPQATAQLPRTGYPAWPAALAGVVLLASGAMLRVSPGLRR